MSNATRFLCCGGSDEHPPEHTQDCSRTERRPLAVHSHTESGRNLCDPGYGWLTPGSYAHRPPVDRASVTCKRCLASLAKRDREFQRKAWRWLEPARRRYANSAIGGCYLPDKWEALVAARAIAREEGRS